MPYQIENASPGFDFRGKITSMSASDLDASTMNQFRHSGVESHSTILLGAGASITSGLPSWNDFARELLVSSGAVNESSAELLLKHQEPMIAVESARAADESTWEQRLSDALYEGVKDLEVLEPSPLHLATVGHYLESRSNRSILTLNFDVLIEQTLLMETQEVAESVTRSSDMDHKNAVFHLHGVITPDKTENVILTLNDFTKLIEDKDSWQSGLLSAAVSKGALIIAGTSYRDPDLRQWLYSALKYKPRNHKAFVLLARESFKVSKEEFSNLKKALSSQWRAVGLHPVFMHDHTDAAQIIRELKFVNDADYVSPKERCRLIWEAHERNFGKLQPYYVEQLSLDAEDLKECFNVETLDVTLWLSNGDGHLVRWASQDREYRTVDALRVVETGHDSPWIAGQAFAAESRIVEDLSSHPTRRWKSVVALPVVVEHPKFPIVSSAVLTVGLPKTADSYESKAETWGSTLAAIAVEWSEGLFESVYSDSDA